MSHVRMFEATIVSRIVDAEDLLEALQDVGLLHVRPIDIPDELADELISADPTSGVEKSPVRFERSGDVRDTVARLEHRRRGLRSVPPAPASMQDRARSYDEVCERVDSLLDRRAYLEEERRGVETTMAALRPWGDFDPKDLGLLEDHGVILRFYLPTRLEWNELDRSGLTYQIVRETSDLVWVCVIGDSAEAFDDLPLTPTAVPQESLSDLRSRRDELTTEIEATNAKLSRYRHFSGVFASRIEALADRITLLEARDGGVLAGPLYAMTGYVPVDEAVALQSVVARFGAVARLAEPTPGDDVPVKLRNRWWTAGFEVIVRSFSGISYWEKDFTWAVGLLFVLFGSLCLLDAGYGLLLALTGLALGYRGDRTISRVFVITGVVSVLVGLLSGQVFGVVIGQHVWDHLQPPLTLATDPNSAFAFSLLVGVVMIGFSNLLAIWQKGLKTHATGALLLVTAGFSLILGEGLAGYVITVVQAWQPPSPELLALFQSSGRWGCVVLLIAAAAAFVMWPEPVFGASARAGNVVWTLYSGTTGFVQDVLSHMRLFGIALSGSIMALVVNDIGGRLPLPLTVLFALVGHMFVFLLALLSLYIHTNRLIFLEVGSKSFSGGSSYYTPFRRKLV